MVNPKNKTSTRSSRKDHREWAVQGILGMVREGLMTEMKALRDFSSLTVRV